MTENMTPEERSQAYAAPDLLGSREARLKRLKVKLREHVRRLHYREIFSSEWLALADSINQVAEVAFMEMNLPFDTNSKVRQVKGRKESGTLWDQEDEQLAITVLLEEGKINLCLRMLAEYLGSVVDEAGGKRKIADAAQNTDHSREQIQELSVAFEKGMGIIMHFALEHVEVVQILDTGVLLAHISAVMDNSKHRAQLWEGTKPSKFEADFVGPDKYQDFLVVHYMASFMKHVEELDEEKIMDLLERQNLIKKTVNHCIKLHDWCRADVQAACLKFLNSCFDNETFQSEPERFIDDECQQLCVELWDKCWDACTMSSLLTKKDVPQIVRSVKEWRKK